MTSNFLKSTTAIVLSLSLAVPHVAMAQTAAELEAELGVETSNLTEAELDALRKQLADQRAAAAADPQPVENQTAQEDPSALDKAVTAVTGAVNELTGTTDNATEAGAEAAATADAAPAETMPEQPAEAPVAEASPAAPEADAPVETTVDAAPAPEAPPADATTTAETASPETAADTPVDTAEPEKSILEETVDKLQAQVEDLTTTAKEATQAQVEELRENTPEAAAAQAAAEAEVAEEQATSLAAQADSTEGAEVVESTVTEDTARSSSEEFQTQVTATDGNAAASATAEEKDGLDTIGKIALFGLGALAVGQVLKNGSEVVSNSGDRVVVQQPDGGYKVYKNDDVLMFQPGTDVKTYAYADGSTRTVAVRADGTQIETIRAADGTVLRRARVLEDGSQVILFDDTKTAEAVEVNELPQVTKSENTINFRQAQEDELRAALAANLPEAVDRRFSLSQVRNITSVRTLVPEIDVDNITFETGSSVIRPDEAEELAQLGILMRERIAANPAEVFLIEGHTDAVGSAGYNLALSDRRAESVALALTEYFDVPPENMVVQGYGEYDLKVRTALAERANRRASVRRITPLLSGS